MTSNSSAGVWGWVELVLIIRDPQLLLLLMMRIWRQRSGSFLIVVDGDDDPF